MIQDVYEPLEKYQNEFREAFARNASEEFERLVRASGVDSGANHATCRELCQREKEHEAALAGRGRWRFGCFLVWVLIIAGIVLAVWPFIPQEWFSRDFWRDFVEPTQKNWYFFSGGGAAAAYLAFVFFWKVVRRSGIDSSAGETMEEFRGGGVYREGATSADIAVSPATLRR